MGEYYSKMAYRPYSRSTSFSYYRDYDVRGLSNYSLSCCVNALLQSFSATTELLDILSKWHPSDGVDKSNIPLQLRNTLESMRDRTHPAPHENFLESLYRHAIRRGTQQDADEIFHIILNLSQKQMPELCVAQEIRSLYEIKVETQITCLACKSIEGVPNSLFSLPLAIREGDNTLDSCIDTFYKRQNLVDDDTCYCDWCEKKQPATHEQKIVSLPQILCVHLKRFRNERGFTRKLYSKVTFPETFNTGYLAAGRSENVASDRSHEAGEHYSLFAVIVHIGYAMFGHYTAYIRPMQDQTWYYADDSSVKPATWEHVQDTYEGNRHNGTATAYLLLYRKINCSSG